MSVETPFQPLETYKAAAHTLQVDASSKMKPRIVELLNDWQYLERTAHRLTAAWGRHMAEWEGKSALHRHIWDHAESVRRLRGRVREFPGGKPDAPVSKKLEDVANALLFAPSFDDALDGIYLLLLKPLVAAYVDHSQHAHPIHDAPTMAVLHEINQVRSLQWLWFRDYRRQHPHATDEAYRLNVEAAIAACDNFLCPQTADPQNPALPCGVDSDFTLPKFSARSFSSRPEEDFMPYVRADFRHSLEARRLFWAYAYMLEKNLPDDQLAWIYYGHDMPWDWHHDVSRHLWDESRHGDSGYSRLKDFGISIEEVGFPSYNNDKKVAALDAALTDDRDQDVKDFEDDIVSGIPMKPMSAHDLYEAVFFIGMVAENGHFIVKNEAYQDFKDGQDFESAEMMLFDIIDETTHVQYAHRWLPLLAEKAGLSNDGYRERASKMRAQAATDEAGALQKLSLNRSPDNPAYAFYQSLLGRIRSVSPLKNANTCPERSAKPM